MTPGRIYLSMQSLPHETAPQHGNDLAGARRRRLMHLRRAELGRQDEQWLRPQLPL